MIVNIGQDENIGGGTSVHDSEKLETASALIRAARRAIRDVAASSDLDNILVAALSEAQRLTEHPVKQPDGSGVPVVMSGDALEASPATFPDRDGDHK